MREWLRARPKAGYGEPASIPAPPPSVSDPNAKTTKCGDTVTRIPIHRPTSQAVSDGYAAAAHGYRSSHQAEPVGSSNRPSTDHDQLPPFIPKNGLNHHLETPRDQATILAKAERARQRGMGNLAAKAKVLEGVATAADEAIVSGMNTATFVGVDSPCGLSWYYILDGNGKRMPYGSTHGLHRFTRGAGAIFKTWIGHYADPPEINKKDIRVNPAGE